MQFLSGKFYLLTYRLPALIVQLYVATCSPARVDNASYVALGHSTVVGPVSNL